MAPPPSRRLKPPARNNRRSSFLFSMSSDPSASSLLSTIAGPADVKALTPAQLPQLAQEIRDELIEVTSRNGGHIGPNLGVVELTLALHRVFSTPQDQFVFDVA